ncbi:MAG: NAD-dependent epimerase/dehydratase family protein [Halieaceae bacterium]
MDSVFMGCGYVGRQVAAREVMDGGSVEAIVRTDESASRLNATGIHASVGDLEAGIPRHLKLGHKVVYWFAPPQPDGVQDRRIRNFLGSMDDRHGLPHRVVLISTTGVYGDCQGDWVTEDRERRPQTGRAHRRVDAEDVVRNWCGANNITLAVLRVPGIYGEGKLPLERIRQQRPVLAPEFCPWSNRVHVEDLISACLLAARIPTPAAAYNISDGHPSTMTDFFFKVADAAGLERPPSLDLEKAKKFLSAEMQSYLDESKRIDNRLMRDHLGVRVQFPTLDAGLREIFASHRRG